MVYSMVEKSKTGNYYYGARYYNPQTSIWFGVDPLAHKYPHVTPYNFVEGNPIILIDPTGMGPTPWQKIKYRFKRFAYKFKQIFKKSPELNTMLYEAEVTANRLGDAMDINNIKFDLGAGIKDFKFGPLGKVTLDGTILSIGKDPSTGYTSWEFMNIEAGLWLGNSIVGCQIDLGIASGENSEIDVLTLALAGGLNIGDDSGGEIGVFQGSVYNNTEGWFSAPNSTFSEVNDPSRMIELDYGNPVPMLIIGGEVHYGILSAEIEVNVDGVVNAITRDGSGIGTEWQR